MKRLYFSAFTLLIFLFAPPIFAETLPPAARCESQPGNCAPGFSCQRVTEDTTGFRAGEYRCIETPSGPLGILGKIVPPQAIINFGFGSAGLSNFLSNLVGLIYGIAAIVLIFMIVWGAFDWMTSEGDKEKLERARNKIMNAIIGILIFAAAFGIIRVLGQFTGFKFFVGQDQVQTTSTSNPSGNPPSAGGTNSTPAACLQTPCYCETNPSVCFAGTSCKPNDPNHNNAGCAP